jgi:hypothetical protein
MIAVLFQVLDFLICKRLGRQKLEEIHTPGVIAENHVRPRKTSMHNLNVCMRACDIQRTLMRVRARVYAHVTKVLHLASSQE